MAPHFGSHSRYITGQSQATGKSHISTRKDCILSRGGTFVISDTEWPVLPSQAGENGRMVEAVCDSMGTCPQSTSSRIAPMTVIEP